MGKQVLKGVTAALLMGAAVIAHAEAAPVYDVDSMQNDYGMDQQATAPQDQGQDLPMPPPPGQEGAYVPSAQHVSNRAPTIAMVQDNSADADKRIKQLEQQLNTMQTNSSSARIEALQKEIQMLRGQVEQLTHQSEKMQEQQKTMYTDLDKRISSDKQPVAKKSDSPASDSAEAGSETKAQKTAKKAAKPAAPAADTETPAVAAAPAAAEPPAVAEEQQIYQTAYNQIKAKKYDDAVKTLQGMLKKYPSGQFAANAHYWLGELYGLMGRHDDALSEFNTVARDYPKSPRISDAQLKIGLIYAAQFSWAEAKATFKKIISKYPGTASARLASEQLKQIKDAGH